tara:strand:+ start:3334 stop:3795 length:462 start_codon:yes stop_codon:yes gene_type:complete
MNLRYKFSEIICTVFYIGKLPLAPGTFGSLAALICWFLIKPYVSDPLFLLINGGIFFLGIACSEIIVSTDNVKDPQFIVIDEWVGMWIGLYLVEHSILWGLAAFFCFRIFDIFKPGPIGEMDKMEGGIGVMMDDVVAGILTCLLMQSLSHFSL